VGLDVKKSEDVVALETRRRSQRRSLFFFALGIRRVDGRGRCRRLHWIHNMRLGHQPSDGIPQERIVRSAQRENLARNLEFRLAELPNNVGNRASGELREFAKRLDVFPWKANRKTIHLVFASSHGCVSPRSVAGFRPYVI